MNTKRKKRGRPGVTVEEVQRACEALAAQGRTAGPTNVRIELGKGSYETIIKHLRTLGYSARVPRSRRS